MSKKIRYREGQVVKLKTLERICEEDGVSDWKEIRNPMLNDEGKMNHLFGSRVRISRIGRWGYNSFEVISDGYQWNFSYRWIDDENIEFGAISDELFNI